MLAAAGLLSGCVAAVVPLAAGAAMGGKAVLGDDTAPTSKSKATSKPRPAATRRAEAKVVPASDANPRVQLLPAGSVLPPPTGTQPLRPAPVTARAGAPTIGGAGETASLRTQALLALENHIELRIRYLRDKSTAKSVLLTPGSTAAEPQFETCGARPPAVLFDADILTDAYLAATALRVRDQGVALLFESSRPEADPATTAAALDRLGLWSSASADSLWLPQAGDPPGNDTRRARIAARYCVVALVGDRVTDFSDLFAASDQAAGSRALAALWGAGWFLLPAAR